MGGLFNRLKVWAFQEVVKSNDLNAEIDNIIANLKPDKFDNYSANLAQMQTQTSPGDVGSESLSTSLGSEIERLRFVVARIVGKPYWYQSPSLSLEDTENTIRSAIGLPRNRIISGPVDADNQPAFLKADGTVATVTLKASVGSPFICFINGSQFQFTSDIVFTGLSTAPTTNNTMAVNDVSLLGNEYTKLLGENRSKITVDAMGLAIQSLVGQFAAFKNPNASNEILYGRVLSTTQIDEVRRGYFFNDIFSPIVRDVLNDNDILTLMRTGWVFLNSSGGLDVTYNTPIYSGTQPQSPSIGDYWFDQANEQWKRFSGSGFVVSNSIFVGFCVQDSTKCFAARSADFYSAVSVSDNCHIAPRNTSSLRVNSPNFRVGVYGARFNFQDSELQWSYPTDLVSGLTPTNTKCYYAYLTNEGMPMIDEHYPYDRNADLGGWYHPYKPWLCIGGFFVDGAGLIDQLQVIAFEAMKSADFVGKIEMGTSIYDDLNPIPGMLALKTATQEVRRELYFRLFSKIGLTVGSTTSDTFSGGAVAGLFPRFWDNGSGIDPDAASRSNPFPNGNTGDKPGSYQGSQNQSHNHLLPQSAGAGGIKAIGGASVANANSPTYPGDFYTANSGGTEARSQNVSVAGFVKY